LKSSSDYNRKIAIENLAILQKTSPTPTATLTLAFYEGILWL